ncbi:MAG: formimidoylglutamase [Legionella sp.]|nr:formimidoylglutamase [Legionella sp.]
MLPDILNYEPPSKSCWQGRKDSLPGERFFQHVNVEDIRSFSLDTHRGKTVFLGFSSDEGIRRNEGRVGAKTGPRALRAQLARLSCHTTQQFIDIGDIVCEQDELELAQEQFARLINYCHQQGCKTVAFGGGHEIAWGHFSGLTKKYAKLGIINFDAHFDLRPPTMENHGTSGTPFWQINNYCQQNNLPFNYCCLGIQPHANTQSLFTTADNFKVSYLPAEQINKTSFAWQAAFIDEFILNHDALYLSICLDVFAECYAPGVSAPQALGLTPWQALPLLKYIMQTGKVVSIDIAELSPPFDENHKTARLAAAIMAELLEFN